MSDQNIKFMKIACLEADNSSCLYKVGCVAVKDDKVLIKTYNETLPGEIYCQPRQTGSSGEQCIRKKLNLKDGNQLQMVCTSHAEINLIAEAAASNICLLKADVYITTFPCVICSKALVRTGIGRLLYMSDHAGNEGQRYFIAALIPVIQIKEKEVWK